LKNIAAREPEAEATITSLTLPVFRGDKGAERRSRAPATFAFAIANRQATLAKTMILQAESKAEKFCTCVAKMPKAKTPKISHFIESEH
jgi:hypothetical protein